MTYHWIDSANRNRKGEEESEVVRHRQEVYNHREGEALIKKRFNLQKKQLVKIL